MVITPYPLLCLSRLFVGVVLGSGWVVSRGYVIGGTSVDICWGKYASFILLLILLDVVCNAINIHTLKIALYYHSSHS